MGGLTGCVQEYLLLNFIICIRLFQSLNISSRYADFVQVYRVT